MDFQYLHVRIGAVYVTLIFTYHGQTTVNIGANTLYVMCASSLCPCTVFTEVLISNFLHVKFLKHLLLWEVLRA